MEFGICMQSIIPVRAEPGHRTEMVTQLLFGELYRITEYQSGWCKIQVEYDNYEGWIPEIQVNHIDQPEFLHLAATPVPVASDLVQILSHENRRSILPVVAGSSLPGLTDSSLRIAGESFLYEGSASIPDPGKNPDVKLLLENAGLYLNAPYLWGGRTPFGIDCSGFVQLIYKISHIRLLRDAAQQATQGEIIPLLEEAEPGDLVFFDNEEGEIVHTGILFDRSHLIHCSGHVKINLIDHEGIFDEEAGKYTHRLRLIRRIL